MRCLGYKDYRRWIYDATGKEALVEFENFIETKKEARADASSFIKSMKVLVISDDLLTLDHELAYKISDYHYTREALQRPSGTCLPIVLKVSS